MVKRIGWMAVALLAVLTAGAKVRETGLKPKAILEEAAPTLTPGTLGQRATDWTMFRHDPLHSGSTSENVVPPLAMAWIYSTHQPIVSSPTIVNGWLYLGSRDSTLHVINATTGKPIWKYKTRGWIDSSPTMYNGTIYFASRDGYIYSLNPFNRRLTWRHYTGGTDCSSPAVMNGILYAASGYPNTHILALNSRSGQTIWTYQTQQPVYSSPAVKDGIAYIGSNDGKFYALSPERSAAQTARTPVQLKWEFQTGGGIYFSSPAVAESLIYCIPGDYDKHIYCIRIADGTVKWSYEVVNLKTSKAPQDLNQRFAGRIEGDLSKLKGPDWTYPFVYVSSPTLAHYMVYFVSGYPEQSLYALDALQGSLKWSQPIGATIGLGYSSSPVVAGPILYVGSGEGTIYAFDALTGSSIWSYDTGSPIISSPAVANDRLYIANWAGDLYCFEAAVGPLASAGTGKFLGTTQVMPRTYALLPPTPNPFTTATTLPYTLPGSRGAEGQRGELSTYQLINLSVYDLAGRLVKTLVDETKEPGYYQTTWDRTDSSGKRVAGGLYFCRMFADEHIFTRKLILLR